MDPIRLAISMTFYCCELTEWQQFITSLLNNNSQEYAEHGQPYELSFELNNSFKIGTT